MQRHFPTEHRSGKRQRLVWIAAPDSKHAQPVLRALLDVQPNRVAMFGGGCSHEFSSRFDLGLKITGILKSTSNTDLPEFVQPLKIRIVISRVSPDLPRDLFLEQCRKGSFLKPD